MENTVKPCCKPEKLKKNFINFALVLFLPNFDIDFRFVENYTYIHLQIFKLKNFKSK